MLQDRVLNQNADVKNGADWPMELCYIFYGGMRACNTAARLRSRQTRKPACPKPPFFAQNQGSCLILRQLPKL